jgi:hypothetical protein
MRDGDPGQRGRGHGGADAGHDLEGDAGLGEGQRFFSAAAEDEGVPALEAHHALAALGGADQDAVDLLLGDVVAARALADVEALRLARELEHGRVHQGVVEDEVGLGQPPGRAAREEIRITRAAPTGDSPLIAASPRRAR